MIKSIITALFVIINGSILSQDSSIVFCKATSKIILIGKETPSKENNSIDLSFLKKLNTNGIFPKYVLLEISHAKAFILNRYMENGDVGLLKDLFPLDSATQNHYTKLKALNGSLSASHRFNFAGVNYDYDYEATHLALRYLLLNSKEFSENSECTRGLKYINYNERFDYLICSFIDQRLNDIRISEDIELMLDILNSQDSLLVINKMGSRYSEAKLILSSYLLSKARKKGGAIYSVPGNKEFRVKRERFVANNIYNFFMKDTSAYIFGSFTSYYKLFKEPGARNNDMFNAFANLLNNNQEYLYANNNICASVIIYRDILKQQSNNYDLNKDELAVYYKIGEPNKLSIKPYTGKYPLISQLLIYNLKP